MSIRHSTTKERGTQLGAMHLVTMSKQIGLTGSNLHPSYIHTKKYSMLLPASPTPLKHDAVPLLPKPPVRCSKRIKILCIQKAAESSLSQSQGDLMVFSFPALVYKQKTLQYIKAMFVIPKLI